MIDVKEEAGYFLLNKGGVVVKGLELSERYYETYGKPMLEARFPELLPRIAIGLVGQGSECFGYDDDISMDHDYGPAFCLWLTVEDYERYGREVQAAYDSLPKDFLGVPGRIVSAQGGERVGVLEIHAFYRQFIGVEQPPRSMMRWLHLPDAQLACATNGKVFSDSLGEFSAIRSAIAVYPEDVRVKKMAARLAIMAQSGQYNYGRSMRRGDVVAAELALRKFVQAGISFVYLYNRRYAPYYKWLYRGMLDLPLLAGEVAGLFRQLMTTGTQEAAWSEEGTVGFNPYVNLRDTKVQLIERICTLVVQALKADGLSSLEDDFLEPHAREVMKRIEDPMLRRCHVMEGA